MCESRAVRSGKVYRQLFDAQDGQTPGQTVYLQRTATHTAVRPAVVHDPSSDIIKQLIEKRGKKHKEALKQLEVELTAISQVCEIQVRTVSLELQSSLQEVDLRLNTLKDQIDKLEHLEHISLQIKGVLKTYRHLLEKISFLPLPVVCRLIHSEATMLNQSLLANRRSVARLLLLLQEENLQQESLLRLHWEDCLSCWRRNRVKEVIDCFRAFCSSEEDQQLDLVWTVQMKRTQRVLTEQRSDIIHNICLLVPPSCSTALVSDWFNQLRAVNQQIESLHADFLHQLRQCYEQMWNDRLAEVQRCQEALSALQLSEEEVNDVVNSQLLTLIGRSQSQDEERLTVLDRKKVRLDDLLAGLRQESSEDALKTSLDKTVCYLQDIQHRLFSEGGDFAPREVKVFQRRLKEETKEIGVTEESIFSELEAFESKSLQQVKEASSRFEEKLSLLKSEQSLSGDPESMKPVRSGPLSGLLRPSRTSEELLDDPVIGIIRSLNRVSVVHDETAEEDRGRPAADPSQIHRLHHRGSESVTTLRAGRSIRTDRRFQVFGPEPDAKVQSQFISIVTLLLWKANDVLLLVAEDFYRSERGAVSRLLLLPDSLDKWAESMQQKLLGYQEQARKFLSTSREELVNQLSMLDELLRLLPAVMIGNHEQQQGAELTEDMGRVRLKLEEMLATSEKEKRLNVGRLRVSLTDGELEAVNADEELRQQQLHTAICSTHLEVQECVRVRGEEFVTSLGSLTEKLMHQLDDLLTPAETNGSHFEDNSVTMETGGKTGQRPCTAG
ncbi:Coiled-coil domain-containing protein 180, partial [Larimichthys crocea]